MRAGLGGLPVHRFGAIPLAMALVLACVACAVAAEPEAGRPNILFIVLDDLNDWVEPLGGHPQVKTPNLERLAAAGTVFSRAYCAAPVCNPSRTAVLTGLRPSTSGIYSNHQSWSDQVRDVVTLPRYFREHGYWVAGGGKIFHGGFNDDDAWDLYAGSETSPKPAETPAVDLQDTPLEWAALDEPDARMADTKTARWAAGILEQERKQPFFLAVGLFRPHFPWYAPRSYFDLYQADGLKLPQVPDDELQDLPPEALRLLAGQTDHEQILATGNWAGAVEAYLANISFADACLGIILEGLASGPHAGNTIVVLWSDHGMHLGEKRYWRKATLWEEATRVPLIIAAPGTGPAGAVSGRTVSLVDLYPTLAELAGLPAREGLDGRSLVPLLRDPEAAWDRPAVSIRRAGQAAVRSERWRYIRYEDGGEELYDHRSDPGENHNLAAEPEHAAVIRDLARWLPAEYAPPAPKLDRQGEKERRQRKREQRRPDAGAR